MQKLQSENSHAHLMGVGSAGNQSKLGVGGPVSDADPANMSQ